jgi:hypothetical protein
MDGYTREVIVSVILKKSDSGTLVPRINVKSVIKLGFVLE